MKNGLLLILATIFSMLSHSVFASSNSDSDYLLKTELSNGHDEANEGTLEPLFLSNLSVGQGREFPLNWKIERHSQHSSSIMGSSCLRLLSPGNRFLPLIPELSTYLIDLDFDVDEFFGMDSKAVRLYYRYNEESQEGDFIDLISDGKNHFKIIKSSSNNGRNSEGEEVLSGEVLNNMAHIIVETNSKETMVTLNGKSSSFFKTTLSAPSVVAVDHGGAHMQEVRLKKLNIYTSDYIKESQILPETEIIFPGEINMMDIPIKYTISAIQRGDLAIVKVKLSGSVNEESKSSWYPYHGRKTDLLTRPYVKILGKRYNCSDTTLVLSAHQREYFYQILYEKPEWPLECEFILESQLPKQFIMSVGYDKFWGETAPHAAGGPSELLVEMPSGKILHSGKALGNRPENQFDIQIESSPDKEIISLIPKEDPRRELAVNFARGNHYFLESESCFFTVNIFSSKSNDLNIEYQIEDAFFTPLSERKSMSLSQDKSTNALPGIVQQSFNVDAGAMKNGVYHLRVRLLKGDQIISEEYRAFEVLSLDENAPSPPLASGLPFMYNAPNEIMNLNNDYFDPWLGSSGLNASHYMSMSTFYPEVARTNEIWHTLDLYKRDWWLWVTSRTAEHPGIDANKDLITHAEHLHIGEGNGQMYYYPYYVFWQHEYRGELLNCLIRYTRTLKLKKTSLLLPKKLENEQELSEDGMKELVETHWSDWLDFHARCVKEYLLKEKNYVNTINPSVKSSQYGPFAIYAGAYKMGWCLKYRGVDPKYNPKEVMDGFFQYEDYPIACGYNIGRGPLTLAAIKLVEPEFTMYPEVYTHGIDGCPDGAVYLAHPPYGNSSADISLMIRKRIFEYAYGAVWHNDRGFDYWRDYGFHTRNWEQKDYEVLLKTWKTVHDHNPVKPLRSSAYIYSEECINQHSTVYPEIVNTAEEDVPFAWEMARTNGHAGGFIASMSSLGKLSGEDTDCLILPPLKGATKAELTEIRRLYSEGVALIGFEDVTGLEDLFGVKPLAKPVAIKNINVNTTLEGNPLAELNEFTAKPLHTACVANYKSNGASVLLEGEAPVLFQYKNTALFNIPPTLVNRSSIALTGYGAESISPLINNSMMLISRHLGNPTISSTEGRVLAFEDTKSNIVINVFGDFWPKKGKDIYPEITLNIENLSTDQIECDRNYTIVKMTDKKAVVQMNIKEDETATLVIKPIKNIK